MDEIGPYQIIEKIGEGGMGEVYKGLDTMLEREVAIKLMRPELINRQEIVDRFKTEAVATGRMNHSNITTLYNFGQLQNQYYMALEFVNGRTLDVMVEEHGAFIWRKAVDYAVAALEGLEYAHQLGIVHRDLKPSNIMVNDQDVVKIMDFGIARILGKSRLTKTGNFIGTLEYTPPEQIRGKEGNARSDIYSLGAVLYELLTGYTVFKGITEFELMNAQINEKPRSLCKLNPKIPKQLDKVVLRALEKNPMKRYASASEFRQALQKILSSDLETNERSVMAYMKNYPAALAAVVLIVPAVSYIVWQINRERPAVIPAVTELPQLRIAETSSSDSQIDQSMAIGSPVSAADQPSQEGTSPLAMIPDESFNRLQPGSNERDSATNSGDVDFVSSKIKKIPIPLRKPESVKRLQPIRIVEPEKLKRAETARNQPNNPESNTLTEENDADIGEWAKDFFGKN